MKFRSILLAEARGSMAGATFSRNGNSAYVRARATPVNPRSTGQTLSRTNLGYVSALWRSLTQLQQDSWKALAQTVPYVNSLGESSFYSGFQLFMKLNKTLMSNDLPVIESAPAGAPTFPGITFSGYSAEQDASLFGDFSLVINTILAGSGVGFSLQIQSTVQVSSGLNFISKSAYRTIVSTVDPVTIMPKVLSGDWKSVFGTPTASLIGSAIFTRLRLLDRASGFVSPWSEFKTVVVEA